MAKQCPRAGACGACQLNGVKYSTQLARKQAYVEGLLSCFGPVAPIIGMENPFHYRNKVQSVFGLSPKGEVVSGIYRLGTHKLIPIRDCMIEDEEADAILQTIKALVKERGIEPYDEDQQVGAIRHVLIRRAVATNQSLVVLVSGSPKFRPKASFAQELAKRHPSVKGVLLNVNAEKTSMVLSEAPCKLIWGQGWIEDELCGLRFRISAKSFYQVNATQAAKLYTIAMRMAAGVTGIKVEGARRGFRFSGSETVLDAYCGTGTIGLIAARWGAGRVIGIELNESAVADAIENAALNGVANASFICGDASAVLKSMAKGHVWLSKEEPSSGVHSALVGLDPEDKTAYTQLSSVDVLFMDPPRSGSDERFLASVIKLSPKTVVYISCDPQTLARDLRYLTTMGPYRMVGAQPVDMFPQTSHIETVVLLARI